METSGEQRRAKLFREEANEALVNVVSTRWEDLTRGGHGKPPSRANRRIWVEIADVVTNEARTPDQCRKRWNSLLAAARKMISMNNREQRRTGKGSAILHTLTAYEELAVALVGPESHSVTSRGVAEPTLETCQVVVESLESTAIEPSPTSQEAEEEEEPLQTPAAVLHQEEEEEEPEEEEEFFLWVGNNLRPARLRWKKHRDQAVSRWRRQGASHCKRRLHGGPVSVASNRLPWGGQTESLISLCRETVANGRDLIQGFEGFSANWSQFSANWSQFPASWSEFSQNFSNWSSEQSLVARETLEAIRQQTAATSALWHALLAGHGAAPQGVVSARNETP
uniref:uncharacterized protein n=1 Tax=Pristiophorus japonicus TaxID=55135 RepID=UPI00398F1530